MRIAGDPGPAAFHEQLVGFLEALGCPDDTVFEHGSFLIAGTIEREKDFFADLGGFIQNRVGDITREILEAGQRRNRFAVHQLVEDKAHVA